MSFWRSNVPRMLSYSILKRGVMGKIGVFLYSGFQEMEL